MNYRAHGFTQRRPKAPGVYLISCDNPRGANGPRREREGWEVAEIYWYAGSYFNSHDITEEGIWRVKALGGSEYCWSKGMWIKGPLTPSLTL